MAPELPRDSIHTVYFNHVFKHATGASNINRRIVLGALLVYHRMNIRDEESTQIIWENLYIQYLLGSDSFISKAAFDSSLFVEILKRMVIEQLNWFKDLNDNTVMGNWDPVSDKTDDNEDPSESKVPPNPSRILVNLMTSPQDITYPTELYSAPATVIRSR